MAWKALEDEDDFGPVMCRDSMPALDSMNSPQAGLPRDGVCRAHANQVLFSCHGVNLPEPRGEELRRRMEEKHTDSQVRSHTSYFSCG